MDEHTKAILGVLKTGDDEALEIGRTYIVFRHIDKAKLLYKYGQLASLNGSTLIFDTEVTGLGSSGQSKKMGSFTISISLVKDLVFAREDILDEINFEKKMEGLIDNND